MGMGGALLIGALRRTRLPFPSRLFEILVCAMATALKQNATPAVRTAFVKLCKSYPRIW
jgi:hypothetical protein